MGSRHLTVLASRTFLRQQPGHTTHALAARKTWNVVNVCLPFLRWQDATTADAVLHPFRSISHWSLLHARSKFNLEATRTRGPITCCGSSVKSCPSLAPAHLLAPPLTDHQYLQGIEMADVSARLQTRALRCQLLLQAAVISSCPCTRPPHPLYPPDDPPCPKRDNSREGRSFVLGICRPLPPDPPELILNLPERPL